MKVNCHDYRKSMELLSLKLRLEKGVSDSEEKDRAEKEIRRLEKELGLED